MTPAALRAVPPFALALALTTAPPLAASRAAASNGPALAVEDTLHTQVPEVLVNAPRVTLGEILDRVARGEAHRDSLVRDRSFLVTTRVVGHSDDGNTPQLLEERIVQMWQKRPDKVRSIELKHWQLRPPKKDDGGGSVKVELGPGMGEDIVNFAFRPSARAEYRYRIEGREVRGDHLIYRIAFEPRSPLALDLPGGLVWVDTKDDVIVRQEIAFRQSPVPLFLKGIKRMVVERQRSGDLWVLSRLLARIETTLPLPRYGRSFDLGVSFTQYAVNTGLPDSLFERRRASGGAK